MADKNQKADFEITPEMGPPRDFRKKPTKKERIKREKEQGMGEVPMVLEVKLTVNEAEDKIRIGKKSGRQTCHRSPGLNLLVFYCLANNCPCERMGKTIHFFMITRCESQRQMDRVGPPSVAEESLKVGLFSLTYFPSLLR